MPPTRTSSASTPQTTPLNIAAIAEASVRAEALCSIPAELIAAQCAIESGWLKYAPHNNCFGIKDYHGAFGRFLAPTPEWFTDHQLARFLALGDGRSAELYKWSATRPGEQPPAFHIPVYAADNSTILYYTFATGDKKRYRVMDWFAAFKTLADCFTFRCRLFNVQPYAPITAQYRADMNMEVFVNALSKIYATDPSYAATVLAIVHQPSLNAAIDEARVELEKSQQVLA